MSDLSKFVRVCRKIICVGRNYRDHALELNNPVPKKPLLFLKPPSSFIEEGQAIEIPSECKQLHHEVELAVIIGKNGKNIETEKADEFISGYALALDMTARDLQDDIKKNGHPWLLAKCWDTFCPISRFLPKDEIVASKESLNIWLKVNDSLRQNGSAGDMIFSVNDVISYASKIMTLERGDVILTGTPKGVGPVNAGDVITCGISGLIEMKFQVT